MRDAALLVLEDGAVFHGKAWGGRGRALGEIVFATAMTGYQETFTDPSYHRQILVMTAPHIGNTGVNAEDRESERMWPAGIVCREPARRASSWRSEGSLEDELAAQELVAICEVDTRAITRHLRERGVMRAGIFSGSALPAGAATGDAEAIAVLLEIVAASPQMGGANLAGEVSTPDTYVVDPIGDFEGKEPLAHVVAVDLGIKARSPWALARRGAKVSIVPRGITLPEVLALKPDGVFFSNGPGDPATADDEVELLRGILDEKIPYFGICFGNQILGRALGYGTYKLAYGHRGVNQPVMHRETGRVEITSHNHGFALDVPLEPSIAPFDQGRYGRVEVTHVGLNDSVVEGIRCLDLPAFSVQFHPEAAAGPHDGEHLFDRFIAMMKEEA